ncbi:hypothetical protein IC582_022245 [Cucumis melo]|uniref:Uncharacterized protein LOC103482642 n=1 Tax=Cucumis melo TaxID=3656 RepID=A0A1S3ASX0_CUCME|nr:uncharacterized protein LOC103482642 [Cucumis melo]
MESSTPGVSMEVQQQKIFALLHCLMGCNRNLRLTSRVLEPENYPFSMMKDAVLDSAMVVDPLTVLSPSEDENEIVNVPKEHVGDNLPKFHPPRKGLSAIRSFPPGCGRGAPPLTIRNSSKGLQMDGSRAKKRVWNDVPLTKVAKKSSAQSLSGACSITRRIGPEDHNISEDPLRQTSRSEDGSIGEEISRGFDNVKSKQGKLAGCPESIAKRVVVQGLTASSNCPWRQGKKMFKSVNLGGKET